MKFEMVGVNTSRLVAKWYFIHQKVVLLNRKFFFKDKSENLFDIVNLSPLC